MSGEGEEGVLALLFSSFSRIVVSAREKREKRPKKEKGVNERRKEAGRKGEAGGRQSAVTLVGLDEVALGLRSLYLECHGLRAWRTGRRQGGREGRKERES